MSQKEYRVRRSRNPSRYKILLGIVSLLLIGSFGLIVLGLANTSAAVKIHDVHGSATTGIGTSTAKLDGTAIGMLYLTTTVHSQATIVPHLHITATRFVQKPPTISVPTPTVQSSPTPTPVTVQNPYPPYKGTLALNDPLKDNSRGYGWETDTFDSAVCRFANGGYDNIGVSSMYVEGDNNCMSRNTSFTNFVFEMQVTLLTATTPTAQNISNYTPCAGLIFREQGGNHITTLQTTFVVCANGNYGLSGYNLSSLAGGHSSAIHQGFKQPNLLAVVAYQGHLDLYVNHQKVGSYTASNGAYNSGEVGCTTMFVTNTVEAVCNNARVWTI